MIELLVGNVFTKVKATQTTEDRAIKSVLEYTIPNWRFIRHKKLDDLKNPQTAKEKRDFKYWQSWNGRKSFYDGRSKQFLSGLIFRVSKGLNERNIQFRIQYTGELHGCQINDYFLDGIEFYVFQKEAIDTALRMKRGVIFSPTGSGKTLMAKAIYKALDVPTLFVCHRTQLLWQTLERFKSRMPWIADRIGVVGDKNYLFNDLTFATMQTLGSKMKYDDQFVKHELSKFKMIMLDECHNIKANSYHEPLQHCTNALYRFGFSGTVDMRNDPVENFILEGTTGPVIYNISLGQLIKNNLLAKPYFHFVKVEKPDDCDNLDYDDAYSRCIVNNEDRNNHVLQSAKKMIENGMKAFVVVQEMEHGKLLCDLFKKNKLNTDFVNYKTKTADRQKTLNNLKDGKYECLIVSTIMDEGINYPGLNAIVNAGGGKSLPVFFQRIGRAMRTKEEDNHCLIVDFYDKTHPKLEEHSVVRFNAAQTEGFHILNKGEFTK